MNGIINVLKPPGMTSHDVVYFIRRATGIKKVGHTGTLDPEAAGVLPICIGKSTKAVQYLAEKNKKYRASIKFGVTTETQDKYGKIIKLISVPDIDVMALKKLIDGFKGKIMQTPPMYSAIKYKGKKLYQYALEGETVEVKSRQIEIFDISIVDKIDRDEFILDVFCSKGTYIRTLCNDIGEKSGYGAHMAQLIRLESSPFCIEDSVTLEDIQLAAENNDFQDLLYAPDFLFSDLNKITIKKSAEKSAINGNPIFSAGVEDDIDLYKTETMVRLYIEDKFIALGTIAHDDTNDRNFIKIKTLFT
ncbi:tRNA pseudouridine(55) synthase TruB [Lutispora sp.]|uniref:tRNA pseudouridine(55) synthase TruB n=1 Tax=Lutispora sp. TaxID=2828727 RepID=UPI002B1F9695|nr:tRNA pseudouridine(55) synthase TruB [Lutispora sp.]MEA4962715.1 tRNA pseudouridine(55) synthase TruB [Lutispora sp.]